MLDELLNLDPNLVREVLGAAADPAADDTPVHPTQGLANALADGLVQLGYVLRRNPRLAPEVRDELLGLAPRMVLAWPELQAVVAAATRVGGTAAPAKHTGGDPGAQATVIELGSGTVRLVLVARTSPYPETSAAPAAY